MRSQAKNSKTLADVAGRAAFSKKEYASRLGVSLDSVNRRIKGGEIHAVRFGRRILIPASELARILEAN
jgi:excisionase family DNA binding protein